MEVFCWGEWKHRHTCTHSNVAAGHRGLLKHSRIPTLGTAFCRDLPPWPYAQRYALSGTSCFETLPRHKAEFWHMRHHANHLLASKNTTYTLCVWFFHSFSHLQDEQMRLEQVAFNTSRCLPSIARRRASCLHSVEECISVSLA